MNCPFCHNCLYTISAAFFGKVWAECRKCPRYYNRISDVRITYIKDTNQITYIAIYVDHEDTWNYSLAVNFDIKKLTVTSSKGVNMKIIYVSNEISHNITPANAPQKLQTILTFL